MVDGSPPRVGTLHMHPPVSTLCLPDGQHLARMKSPSPQTTAFPESLSMAKYGFASEMRLAKLIPKPAFKRSLMFCHRLGGPRSQVETT